LDLREQEGVESTIQSTARDVAGPGKVDRLGKVEARHIEADKTPIVEVELDKRARQTAYSSSAENCPSNGPVTRCFKRDS
jgi:hypothetical protein